MGEVKSDQNQDIEATIQAREERYQAERTKRIRSDGRDQFREMTGDLARFAEDPYADPNFTRDPVQKDVEVVIIGAGLSGIVTGAELRKAGISDLLILDKAGDFGGTWYWNRYPGAACDVEAYIYLPMIEEIGEFPEYKYANAPFIKRHFEKLAEHFGLDKRALMQTAVTEVRWNEDTSRWSISTNREDRLTAKFVVSAGGLLQRPKMPGIPGIENFKGASFHTSRWDYNYTGGSSLGDLNKLKEKRVGIIGTGSTSIQCVPMLGKYSEHLYVFQRTPSSVFPRNNAKTDKQWLKNLKPGWQKERTENFTRLLGGFPEDKDLVADWWTRHAFGPTLNEVDELEGLNPQARSERALFLRMEKCRDRVDEIIENPTLAESLKPYYRYFCKRPAFHDEYLNTFNRPNVTLVDTEGRGIDHITENAVVVSGVEYEVDCLIYSTGFEFTGDEKRRLNAEFYGRDGVMLSEKFADGAETFHGLHSHGFPNLFRISTLQTGTTFNYTHIASELAAHIAYIIRTCEDCGISIVEATAEAERDWVDHIVKLAQPLRSFLLDCTPSYLNREGQISASELKNFTYGDFSGGVEYMDKLRAWRESGDMQGLSKK